jgi:hypothetical protein
MLVLKDYGESLAINYLLNYFNIPYTLDFYNVITNTPINILINIIALKYGMSPLVISLIISFLL